MLSMHAEVDTKEHSTVRNGHARIIIISLSGAYFRCAGSHYDAPRWVGEASSMPLTSRRKLSTIARCVQIQRRDEHTAWGGVWMVRRRHGRRLQKGSGRGMVGPWVMVAENIICLRPSSATIGHNWPQFRPQLATMATMATIGHNWPQKTAYVCVYDGTNTCFFGKRGATIFGPPFSA